MRIPFEIGDKKFLLTPYNTNQEKEILLLSSFGIDDFERVFEILNFKTEYELSENEKKIIIYKYRDISLGDEVDIKFNCDNCKSGNDAVLEASNFIIPNIRNDENIKKLNISVTDENIQEFVLDVDVDELDIQEFEELKQQVKDNQIEFDFIKSTKCLKCGHEKLFDLSPNKYIFEIMSDDTLMSLYKSYNFMIFFGHYSKEDIDKMLPFERSIFIGLLNKVKEDLAS